MNMENSFNSTTLFSSDSNPLTANPITLSVLDEARNVKEWLANEFSKHSTTDNLTQADVAHSINVVMANKLVAKKQSRLIENMFGLLFDHAMTDEPIGENFTLSYMYNVDMSDAATESYLGSAGPSVKIMDIERKIMPPAPHCCNIRINKDLYRKFAVALKAYNGWCLSNRDKFALGIPSSSMLDNPKLFITRVEYENFISHMDKRGAAAANSLIRGDNTHSLLKIIRQSPSTNALPKVRGIKNVMDRSDAARKLVATVPQRSFGINKMIRGSTGDRNYSGSILAEMMQIFEINTDNDGAIDGLRGEILGVGENYRKPDVIAVTTNRMIDRLLADGVCKRATVDLSQTMTLVSLSRDDMHPWNVMAPRSSVTLKNGTYVRDTNRQMEKKTHVSKGHKMVYADVAGKFVVFVTVEDGSFSKNIATDSQMTTSTSFDFTVPTGIHMADPGTSVRIGPARQTTAFANEHGDQYTLSCANLLPFLISIFANQTNYYAEEGDEDVEASMMFYTKVENESSDGEENGGGSENDSNTGSRYKLNEFMRDNYYYDNNIMAMNVISLLNNQTNPKLANLIKSAPAVATENQGEGAGNNKAESADKIAVRAAVKDYLSSNKKIEAVDKDINFFYDILYGMTNTEAVTYLGFINMGFGVIWTKPQFIQADSILFSRPSGFAHFAGAPVQTRLQDLTDESQSILYNSKAYSTTSRQSLGTYPSMMWKNAAVVETMTTTNDSTIDVTDEAALMDALNYQNQMKKAAKETTMINRNLKGEGWWPLLAPPVMPKSHFSSPRSPLGRSGINFTSEDMHDKAFFDKTVADCFNARVYTQNTVFTNMKNNINTTMLYDRSLFLYNEDFPFYKYMNFNPISTGAINSLLDIATTLENESVNIKRPDTDGVLGMDETNLSYLLGAAIPKTCWTDSDMNAEVLVRNDFKDARSYRTNNVITKGGTDFFINGHDFVGKWDRCSVNEYSFL